MTTYHKATVDGVGVFYREAGPPDAPTLVLLHGFPSSSREFDTLIPLLATRYHLIAPDFPGFGQSDAPSPASYSYTFDHLAQTTNALLEQLKVDKYHLRLRETGDEDVEDDEDPRPAKRRKLRLAPAHEGLTPLPQNLTPPLATQLEVTSRCVSQPESRKMFNSFALQHFPYIRHRPAPMLQSQYVHTRSHRKAQCCSSYAPT